MILLPAVAKGKMPYGKNIIFRSGKASETLFRAASPKTCQTNLLARQFWFLLYFLLKKYPDNEASQ
jgi:hypothetical protein